MVNEPLGLLFTGGEGPPPEVCHTLISGTGAFIAAAADSGLVSAEAAGIRPDWITGDMDSLGADAGRLVSYPPERVLRYPSGKDYTDTELAFSLLREKGCVRVWILGGGGGRIDHLFALRSLFEREKPPERWVTAHDDIRCLDAPAVLELSSGGKPAVIQPVSVFPLGCGPWKAESSGLRWPLAGLPWERGFFGVSNEAPEGRFTIKAKKGRFLVIIPLSASFAGQSRKAPGELYNTI
jgi:thiamine pyrophosphokinase